MTYNLNFDDLLKHMMNRYELIHQDALITLDALGEEVGQAFTSRIHGLRLTDVVFYISRNAAFNGTLVANLYEIAVGTAVGTTAIPAGAALATSDNVTQADIAEAIGLVNFNFPDPYTLVPGHAYAIVIEVTVLAAGQVNVGIDNSAPTHTGNLVEFLVGVWVPQAAQDCIFYLFSFSDVLAGVADVNLIQYLGVACGPANPIDVEDTGLNTNPRRYEKDNGFVTLPVARAGLVATAVWDVGVACIHNPSAVPANGRTAGGITTVYTLELENPDAAAQTAWLEDGAGVVLSVIYHLPPTDTVVIDFPGGKTFGDNDLFINASINGIVCQIEGTEV